MHNTDITACAVIQIRNYGGNYGGSAFNSPLFHQSAGLTR